MDRQDSFTDDFIPAGTVVRYDGLIEGGPEFGVVVKCWFDAEIKAYDCYVAFFGAEIPEAKPAEKPYLLRYTAMSLARLDVSPKEAG